MNSNWMEEFQSELKFSLDDFQIEALKVINNNENVLVAAPTGAGKTIVGDAAIFYNLRKGPENRVFYTTPIKALSNQKYNELCRKYGAENVGLITGDIVINRMAQIVVMTTEVLRNMIYASADQINDLECVIIDEVHFLGDRIRGSVWEEVIIHLPNKCKTVSLSATVSNLEEFGGWLNEVRSNCKIILSEKRPVPLEQLVILSDDSKKSKGAKLYSLYEGKKINADIMRKMRRPMPSIGGGNRQQTRRVKGRIVPNAVHSSTGRKIPRKTDIIEALEKKNMLPCIYFIFSRKGCDNAVDLMSKSKISYTSDAERKSISEYIDTEVTKRISTGDYKILEFEKWRSALINGFAVHHAGIIPVFKEAVEYMFERGWIKVVFATETLALGVNMPARSVIIEKLTKYNGITNARLTPGQYTQLTGRAGRRGMDTLGYAIVVDDYKLEPNDIASLASTRVYPLISSFMPGYNMAANLVNTSNYSYAKEVLSKSFAQYQLNHKNRLLEKRIVEYNVTINEYKKELDNPDPKTARRWKNRYDALVVKRNSADKELNRNNNKIVNRYDNILKVLNHFEYIVKTGDDYNLTPKGNKLMNLYCEYELVFTECLMGGVFDNLSPVELAVAISPFISLSKNSQDSTLKVHKIPNGENSNLGTALKKMAAIYKDVYDVERRTGVLIGDGGNGLNYGILVPIFDYANGASLDTVFDDQKKISLGDFVRCSKGIIDILSQISRYHEGDIVTTAKSATELLDHGIVSLFME